MSEDFNKDLATTMVEQTAGKAYDDVMHPGLEATGKVFSLLPRTIRAWFSKWEKWLLYHEYSIKETEKLLADKLKDIPEEKIVEPEPYVAVPALQQLSYSFDSKELREMYANLLASSMNADKKWSVHPSFVDIIAPATFQMQYFPGKFPVYLQNYSSTLIFLQYFPGSRKKNLAFC